ncbi:MAG: methyltransferase domain-containing protein [Deltaproteobacteria bacterium]|nr:methyltransferase domain-containing protein [Deltaproteobacteria bacterium]
MSRRDDTFRGRVAGATQARYDGLSTAGSSLSCGGALDDAAPLPGETVVDLGCGRGGDVVKAAGRVGPSGAAVGVDASPSMLAVARERAAGHPQARFVESDLAAVALPDGLADVVVSNCAINHAPDKAAVYREIHRLLRPGGRFAVSDVVSEAELPAAVREDPAAWAACYGGSIPEAEYLAAIAAAGFAEVAVRRRTEPYEKGGVLVRSITVEGRRAP